MPLVTIPPPFTSIAAIPKRFQMCLLEAAAFFPYEICPTDLDPALLQSFRSPSSLLSYSGLQSIVQESLQDHGIDPDNYAKDAKGKVREGIAEPPTAKDSGRGRGRGKSNNRFS